MPSRTKRSSRPKAAPKRYPTDLTDDQWDRIKPLVPRSPMQDGEPTVDLREVVNAIRFKTRITGGWSMLPTEFGSRDGIHLWFRRFLRRLLFRIVHDIGAIIQEDITNRTRIPSTIRQNARPGAGSAVAGRYARLHLDNVTVADITRISGSQAILGAVIKRWPWIKHMLCDGPHDRGTLASHTILLEFIHEVARRIAAEPIIESSTRRSAAKCNAASFMRWRPVVRQYEERLDISDTPEWPWETC